MIRPVLHARFRAVWYVPIRCFNNSFFQFRSRLAISGAFKAEFGLKWSFWEIDSENLRHRPKEKFCPEGFHYRSAMQCSIQSFKLSLSIKRACKTSNGIPRTSKMKHLASGKYKSSRDVITDYSVNIPISSRAKCSPVIWFNEMLCFLFS